MPLVCNAWLLLLLEYQPVSGLALSDGGTTSGADAANYVPHIFTMLQGQLGGGTER